MTLLPEVERELLRVARAPLLAGAEPWGTEPQGTELRRAEPPRAEPPGTEPRSVASRQAEHRRPRRALRVARPRWSGAFAFALTLAALALGGIFAIALHHGGAGRPTGHSPRPTPAGTFPGAPRTQGGGWRTGAEILCPLAAPNRYLPPRSGCVTVLRADLDGDGRPDLVLLYARLGRREGSDLYMPTAFVLEVVRGQGGVVQARISTEGVDAIVAGVERVSDRPGVALLIGIGRTSSGAAAGLYTMTDGRLVNAGPSLAWGGDSAVKAGFSCRTGHPPTIVQRLFVLEGPTIYGNWKRTDVTYAWRGARLRQIAQRTATSHGLPPRAATSFGAGCHVSLPMATAPGRHPGATAPHHRTATAPVHPARISSSATCTARDLRLALGPSISPATGEDGDLLVLRNDTARPCALVGYPHVTLSYGDGALPFVYQHGGEGYVTTSRPHPVLLEPTGRAYILVAKNECVGRNLHAATRIAVSLPGATSVITLRLRRPGVSELDYCQRDPAGGPIDPGNQVIVSPVGQA